MPSPYTYFLIEKERYLQLLINAGLDEDLAYETAHYAALDKAEKKIGKVIRGAIMETTT
jgi:hypothetical protein